jgi:hypothetical protein
LENCPTQEDPPRLSLKPRTCASKNLNRKSLPLSDIVDLPSLSIGLTFDDAANVKRRRTFLSLTPIHSLPIRPPFAECA